MKNIYIFLAVLFCMLAGTIEADAKYWKKAELPASAQNVLWLDIFFIDAQTGWACGRGNHDVNGRIARTTDGGKTWSITLLPIWFLESIHFADKTHGFCSGPDGVYSTTDGGATWLPVSYMNNLIQADLADIWGCYMLSKDTVYLAGGGCLPSLTTISGHRIIWRSTDAGSTWTAYDLTYVPLDGSANYFSGLTDVMVYKNGLGFASSSGLVWKTADYGETWDIASQTSDNMSWQEEITNYPGTNSILVPFSGLDCSGGYGGGGMRFSTDYTNPYGWVEAYVGGSMFGAYLLGSQEGWACGEFRGVYYTNNAGNGWALKNCGIDDGDDLDDIFFISRDNGWVVGDNIYHLAEAEMFVDKDTVDFEVLCASAQKYDTVRIKNMSFDISYMYIAALKKDSNFTVIQPTYPNTPVQPCNEVKVIVKYEPKSLGNHTFAIIAEMTPENSSITLRDTIYYKGSRQEATTISSLDTIDFGDVPVKQNAFKDLKWLSQSSDTLKKYSSTVKDIDITNVTWSGDIFVVSDTGNTMRFKVSPIDTGVIYITYSFEFGECSDKRNVVLKVRGLAPVIKASQYSTKIDVQCKADTVIPLVIGNYGNADLIIDEISIVDTNVNCDILGFASERIYPLTIKPNACDTLKLRLYSDIPDTFKVELLIFSNDTRRFNAITPYPVSLEAVFYKTIFSDSIISIDFGDVCIGRTVEKNASIRNTGNDTAYVPSVKFKLPEYSVIKRPERFTPMQVGTYTIRFNPASMGNFIDTLNVVTTPCSTPYRIAVRGRGVSNKVEVLPQNITTKQNINVEKIYSIEVKSKAIQDITIDTAYMLPVMPDVDIAILNNFPLTLAPDASTNIDIKVISAVETVYNGSMYLHLSSECFDTIDVPVNIEFMTNIIEYKDNSGNDVVYIGHSSHCTDEVLYDTIWVTNTQPYVFKSLKFDDDMAGYGIISDLALPKEIGADGREQVIVAFSPQIEGDYENKLIFEMQDKATNGIEYDTVTMRNTYHKAITSVTPATADFGKFESCDAQVSKIIILTNTGTLADTAEVDISDMPAYYSIYEQKFIIEPESSTEIEIVLDPAKVPSRGKHTYSLKISTKVCPQNYVVELQNELDSIKLGVSHSSLDFGEVWINSTKTMTVSVHNPSTFDIKLKNINIFPSGNFTHNTTLPVIIPANGSMDIAVSFVGAQTDNYVANMELAAERTCRLSCNIPLSAYIPIEKYIANIRIDKTHAVPGDTVVISAYVDKAAPELNAAGIDFTMNMDYNLFHPQKMYIIENSTKKELDFVFNPHNGISANIAGIAANDILSNERKFLEIHGIALISTPDNTQISFNKFDIETDKRYEITQENGELALDNFCASNLRDVAFLPTFSVDIAGTIICSNETPVIFKATGDIAVEIELLNLLGESAHLDKVLLNKGNREYMLKLNNFSNGIYNLIFKTNYYKPLSKQLIIMK